MPLQSDVLNSFGKDTASQLLRLGFTVAILIHYPVVHFSFRETVSTALNPKVQESTNPAEPLQELLLPSLSDSSSESPAVPAAAQPMSTRMHVIATSATCFATLGISLVLPHLSDIFSLTGSLCAFPYCFIIPSMIYLRAPELVWLKHCPGAVHTSEQYDELLRGNDVQVPVFSGWLWRRHVTQVVTLRAAEFTSLDHQHLSHSGRVLPRPHSQLQRYSAIGLAILFAVLCVISFTISMKATIHDLS